jgi:hypothetical protein
MAEMPPLEVTNGQMYVKTPAMNVAGIITFNEPAECGVRMRVIGEIQGCLLTIFVCSEATAESSHSRAGVCDGYKVERKILIDTHESGTGIDVRQDLKITAFSTRHKAMN